VSQNQYSLMRTPMQSEIPPFRRFVDADEMPQSAFAESLNVRGSFRRHADAELSLSLGDRLGRRWAGRHPAVQLFKSNWSKSRALPCKPEGRSNDSRA
jgi:hypothetical protein